MEPSSSSSRKRLYEELGDHAESSTSNGTSNGLRVSVSHKDSSSNGYRNTNLPSPFKSTSLFRTVTMDTKTINAGSKTFNDPIHKFIKLEGLCLRIVDTYQFQRLHSLKQLGVCDYVFRGATHSRFTHSLGVAHLAEKMARALMSRQPELELTEIDVACIKVAGLCHDLGHGPFSHVYDGVFIKRMWPKGISDDGSKWRHEDGSVQMFNYLLQSNKIDIARYGLTPRDKLFIEEVIGGVKEDDRNGRGPGKFFLYDIVNNALSGLDVDKLDYFQRDMRMTNVKLQADFDRFIDLARVLPALPILNVQGRRLSHGTPTSGEYVKMICYPEKMLHEALNAFATRFHMHTLVYTHRSVKCIEFMVCDALEAADPHIRIEGTKTTERPDGLYKISECIFDMQALSNLKDSIIDIIRYERNPSLAAAKNIVKRIDDRDLYVCVGTTAYTAKHDARIHHASTDDIIEEIVSYAQSFAQTVNTDFSTTHGQPQPTTAVLGKIVEGQNENETEENAEEDEDSKLFADFTTTNLKSLNQSSHGYHRGRSADHSAAVDARMDRSTVFEHSQSSNISCGSSFTKYSMNLTKEDIIVEKVSFLCGTFV
jgi:HD superfamily phosphohydrolase